MIQIIELYKDISMNHEDFLSIKAIAQALQECQKARMRKAYLLENIETKIENARMVLEQLLADRDAIQARKVPPRPDISELVQMQNKMNAQIEKCAFFVLYNAHTRALHIARRSPDIENSLRIGAQEIALNSVKSAHIWPCYTESDAERLYKILAATPEIFELLP